MNSILSLRKIKKQFGHHIVLNSVSFDIPRGSIFAFLGANGAGKSTLLNIITQTLLPTSGTILMNGKELQKEKIGVVFQENTLDDELTIYDNLMIRGRLYSISKNELKSRIITLSKALGMDSFLFQKFQFCSGGQKRIAVIARSLVMNPSLLIMDEATTALDIEIRKRVWNYLLKLNKEQGLTIFFSSHYIEEAKVASNLCILKSGKIIYSGTYQNLIANYSRKKLKVIIGNRVVQKEILSIPSALSYLEQLDLQTVNAFSLQNSSLEDIFLRLIGHENFNL